MSRWLPEDLLQQCSSDNPSGSLVPMSAWPSTAWRLSKAKPDSYVSHALLCLTLVLLGVRTQDMSLITEASRHYDRVLLQLQQVQTDSYNLIFTYETRANPFTIRFDSKYLCLRKAGTLPTRTSM